MGRYRGPRCRLCRREGISLCFRKKCAHEVRESLPGQHGAMRRGKLSNYGLQLREKQKVKRLYGLLERQFRGYYEKASRTKGVTGFVLLQQLERRLDNVLFRLGFARTRPQGRQIVGHGFVKVNNQKVDIPSFQVKAGDEITLTLNDKSKNFINAVIEWTKEREVPQWLTADVKNYKGKVNGLPTREDIQFPINERLIVELYSK